MLAIFALALLVRLTPLNRYETPDEPIWVQRSVLFADAVAARDWATIPQTGHPGLTTMALGALGIRLTAWLRPAEAAVHLAWIRNIAWLAPENDAAFAHLAFFLPAARLLVMLVTAAGVALVYGIGRRRLGERAARWLACFLALDPFFGGLSGLLHTDALQATFILLGVLVVLPQSTRRSQRVTNFSASSALSAVKRSPIPWGSLILSALCLALAGMTKTLGLLVAPGVALALLLLPREPWARRVLRVAVLTVLTTALYLLLYPPFWVNPHAALKALIGAATYHEGIGLRNVFFAGQVTADPGPLFYPAVLLFRLTPPVLSGLALAVLDAVRKGRRDLKIAATASGWFWLPVLVYFTAITLATKKFDRYALTVMVLLSGVAAPAWACRSARWRWALLVALLLPWALVAPLPLYYADPLTGGPWLARQIIPLGWGERDGIAATALAHHLPDPATKTLLTSNVPGAASFFPGTTQRIQASTMAVLLPCGDALITTDKSEAQPGFTTVGTLRLAGFPLATLHTQTLAFPTDLPLVLPGPLPGAPVEAVAPSADAVTLRAWLEARFASGDAFLWVHAPACYLLNEAQLAALLDAVQCQPAGEIGGLMLDRCVMPALLPAAAPFRARFAGVLDLVAAAWPPTAQATDALAVRLRWQAQTPLDALNIYLTLRDAADNICAQGGDILTDDRAWRTPAWEPGAFVEGTAYVPIDLTLPPGVYTLTLSVSGSAGGMGLTLANGAFGGTRVELGQVNVIAPRYPATELPGINALAAPVSDLAGLRLLGAGTLPAEVWAGGQLPFRLAWERLPGAPPETLRWKLACADNVSAEGDVPLAPSAPATWREGHRYITQYAPRTDPLLPAGVCVLTVGVGSDTEITLGEVTIRQRERRFTLPQPPQAALDVAVGDFARLVGIDVSRSTFAPGETFEVTLYAQATATADRDYTVFVHVVGPDGRIWAQSDSWPERGGAPTTSWVAGQVIVDTHTLALSTDAPTGAYTVFVGLYDAERGPRVPLYDATGAPIPDGRAPVQMLVVSY